MDAALSAAYGEWMRVSGWSLAALRGIGAGLTDVEIANKIPALEAVADRCHVSRIHLAFLRALIESRAA